MKKVTFELCKETALLYDNRTDFQRENNYMYNKSLKNNWLNEICGHMKYQHKPNNYWTKDRCQEISLKYKRRIDFKKNDASVYTTSLNNGWLNEICNHIEYVNTYWDYESCKKESLKFKNRTDFQKNSKGAYRYAKVNDILDELCSNMIKSGDRYHRCVYVFEFDNRYAYVGLTFNLINRERDHKRKGPVHEHLKKYKSTFILKQLTDYIEVEESKKLEEIYIIEYKEKNWKLLNTKNKSTIGGSVIFWDYEKCKEEALKYNIRKEFLTKSKSAALSALKKGWYKEITSHMGYQKSPRCWTIEEEKFLIENRQKGLKYCAEKLNKTYYSVKSKNQHLNKRFNNKQI